MQDIFDIGNIHIFRSSEKGFHAVAFSKFLPKEINEILLSSSCDEAFRNTPRFTSIRNYVLRNFEKGKTPKPEYLMILKGITSREKSYAHYKYFKVLYPQIEEELEHFDDSKTVGVIRYATATNI